MLAKVAGGTGAGSKMHLPTLPPRPWTCAAGHRNEAYAATCLHGSCREKRRNGKPC